MNSGRFTEGERLAIQRLVAGLPEILGFDSIDAMLDALLRAAKPPADDEGTIFERRYAGMKPVFPVEPPPPVNRWKLLSSVLSYREVLFIREQLSKKRGWQYQKKQVSCYLKHVRFMDNALKGKLAGIVHETEADSLSPAEIRRLDLRRKWLFLRLHTAGLLYLVNGPAGERMCKAAANELQAQFTFSPAVA